METKTMANEMNRREFMKASAATGAALVAVAVPLVSAQDLKPIELPKATTTSGNALLEVLGKRKSTRTISGEPLPPAVLSTLLWAAASYARKLCMT
jgi:hypothetical protein